MRKRILLAFLTGTALGSIVCYLAVSRENKPRGLQAGETASRVLVTYPRGDKDKPHRTVRLKEVPIGDIGVGQLAPEIWIIDFGDKPRAYNEDPIIVPQ